MEAVIEAGNEDALSDTTPTGLGGLQSQIDYFHRVHSVGLKTVQALKIKLNTPDYNRPQKTFILSDVERLLGISRNTIRDNEIKGNLQYQDWNPANTKKEYNFNDLKTLREFFKVGFFNGEVERPTHLQPVILSVAMLKGGCGKTTTSTNLAAACSLAGLNTLFVDLDPQASGTQSFGFIPMIDGTTPASISSSLCDDPNDIFKIIRPTHYGNLDIITSSLELQGADLILPNPDLNNSKTLGPALLRLRKAIALVKNRYDVVIFDCAPAHSTVTLNALAASNGLLMTITPQMLTYGSSLLFANTMEEYLLSMQDNAKHLGIADPDKYFRNDIFRVLVTADPKDSESRSVTNFLRRLHGGFVLNHSMVDTIALKRSQNDLSLLYDIKRAEVRKSKESFDRGISSMETVNQEILDLIKEHWGIAQ